MVRPCAVFVCGAVLAQCAAATFLRRTDGFPSFDSFIEKHGRAYRHGSAEYNLRRGIYAKRVADATVQNAKTERLWTAKVNHLWDWSDKEMSTLFGRRGAAWRGQQSSSLAQTGKFNDTTSIFSSDEVYRTLKSLPSKVDWTNIHSLSQIRSQGACGSCWAVAAVTALDAHAEIVGISRTFSAQQIVDCMPNPKECGGQGGCKGATAAMAMEWVYKNGCSQEHEVPYQGRDLACDLPKKATAALANITVRSAGRSFGMTGWQKLPENGYVALMQNLADHGPVAVSSAASGWDAYGSGIYDACPKDAIVNHAVVLIGYGEDGGQKFWQIQNSWGPDWGESGRMKLTRHNDEQAWCGIDKEPEMGSSCKPYPESVKVCGSCGILYDSAVPHFQSVHLP